MKLLSVLTGIIGSAALSAVTSGECLRYEPAEVTLVGTLITRTYPGPPNYQSIAEGDAAEHPYILVLEKPVCVAPDPSSELNAAGASGLTEIQLAFHDLDLAALVGHRIVVSGSLFAAHTGHHRTPVLLWATIARAA